MSQRQHILICQVLEANTAWIQSLMTSALRGNSISESNHAQSTHLLKMYGTVQLDSAAAEGMTRMNNDFGRGHEALVTGRTSNIGKVSHVFGTFHSLPIELQESLVVAAKQNAKSVKNLSRRHWQNRKLPVLEKKKLLIRKRLI